MKTSFTFPFFAWLQRFSAHGTLWVMTFALFVLGTLCSPSVATAADSSGNWNLEDGSGHRLGAVLYERSNIDSSAGLRLKLTAESDGLKLDHARPLMLSDGRGQNWSLANRSGELMANNDGATPVASSQYDASCLNPTPSDGVPLEMTVVSSAGDLSFALSPGQVQTLHSLTDACAN
jgi:hypothetical protein